MEINNLLESANGYKALQEDAKRLADKWGAYGLNEGLNEKETANMTIICRVYTSDAVDEEDSVDIGGARYLQNIIHI